MSEWRASKYCKRRLEPIIWTVRCWTRLVHADILLGRAPNGYCADLYYLNRFRGRSFVNRKSMNGWMMHCTWIRYDAKYTDMDERVERIHVRNLTWEQTEKQPEWRSCWWDLTLPKESITDTAEATALLTLMLVSPGSNPECWMCVTDYNVDQSSLEGTELVATKRRWCVTKSKLHIMENLLTLKYLAVKDNTGGLI